MGMYVSVWVLGFLCTVSDPEYILDCILITGTLYGVTERTTHAQGTKGFEVERGGISLFFIAGAPSPLVINSLPYCNFYSKSDYCNI